jgi:hypothetical protein
VKPDFRWTESASNNSVGLSRNRITKRQITCCRELREPCHRRSMNGSVRPACWRPVTLVRKPNMGSWIRWWPRRHREG